MQTEKTNTEPGQRFKRSFHPSRHFAYCELRLQFNTIRVVEFGEVLAEAVVEFSKATGTRAVINDIKLIAAIGFGGGLVLCYVWSMTERTHEVVDQAAEALKAAGWKESATV